jgi:two-component system sensor histidine kinase FlrB
MSQMETMSANELGQAFDAFNRVSHELDTSYRELESKVAGLTRELTSARSARLLELAEKERLAHRLSSLISVLPGGVLIVDASQSIRDANPEALELLGEPLIGLSWGEVLSRVAGIKKLNSRELELNNGRRISVVSRLLGRTGDHVVLITDVSEIHQLQEQLGHKRRLIAMGEMAARVAHQIRTPLSSATLYLAQLGRQDMAAQQRKKIALKVGDRLNQMGNLVDSMLSFVRGETPTTEVVSLREVMLNFESAILPQMEKSGSRVSIPCLDDTLMIRGDAEELVGCLSNLAMNALESSDGKVLLDLWVGALNSQSLQIKVRDNGPGISEEIMDRIFDPFFTTRALGTGLGLAVVAMTISDHGGEISVKNHQGGGAEFSITLPLVQSSEVGSSSDGNE